MLNGDPLPPQIYDDRLPTFFRFSKHQQFTTSSSSAVFLHWSGYVQYHLRAGGISDASLHIFRWFGRRNWGWARSQRDHGDPKPSAALALLLPVPRAAFDLKRHARIQMLRGRSAPLLQTMTLTTYAFAGMPLLLSPSAHVFLFCCSGLRRKSGANFLHHLRALPIIRAVIFHWLRPSLRLSRRAAETGCSFSAGFLKCLLRLLIIAGGGGCFHDAALAARRRVRFFAQQKSRLCRDDVVRRLFLQPLHGTLPTGALF